MRRIRMIAVLAASVIGLAACGSTAEVSYNRPDEGTLLIYTGAGAFRDVLRYTVDNLLPPTTKVQLVDAPADANERIEAGDADLAFISRRRRSSRARRPTRRSAWCQRSASSPTRCTRRSGRT